MSKVEQNIWSENVHIVAEIGMTHDGSFGLAKKLIESAADIAYHLRWKKQKAGNQKKLFTELNEQEKQVVDFLVGEEGVHLDELIHGTKISTSRIASLLLELELKGMVRALPGNSFMLL